MLLQDTGLFTFPGSASSCATRPDCTPQPGLLKSYATHSYVVRYWFAENMDYKSFPFDRQSLRFIFQMPTNTLAKNVAARGVRFLSTATDAIVPYWRHPVWAVRNFGAADNLRLQSFEEFAAGGNAETNPHFSYLALEVTQSLCEADECDTCCDEIFEFSEA